MSLLRQTLVAIALLLGAGALWVAFVPSAMPVLERVGALDLVGIERAAVSEGESGGSDYGGGPTRVAIAEVGESQINDRAVALGNGRALRSVTVTPEVSGRLTELAVAPGGRVREGDLVARLDAEAERIALDRAEANLADAEDTLARLRRLRETGAVPETELQSAELAQRTAALSVREAEYALGQRRIAAPIGGWVGILDVESGDRVTPETEIARIEDRSRILVEFSVPERLVGRISPGDDVSATPVSGPDTELTGTVRAIDNRVEETTRTIVVQAAFDNPEDRLRGGMAFRVALDFPGESYPSVDPLAIQWGSDGAYVWRAESGTAQRIPVRIVQRNADSVLVEAEIAPGEMLVTEGVQTLDPGAEIEVEGAATARARPAAAGSET